MRLCFIGSGVERETTRMNGIEVTAIAQIMRGKFDTLVFGGSSVGLMESFATAFAAAGGKVVCVVPRWLEDLDLIFANGERVRCEDLAERKKLMFDEVDAVLCYPGGVGTWDELFDLLARRAIDSAIGARPPCPPVYLYNWEKFYAPLLLQMETAVEAGLLRPEAVAMVHPFESGEGLTRLLTSHGFA